MQRIIGYAIVKSDGSTLRTGAYYGSSTTKLYISEARALAALKASKRDESLYSVKPVYIMCE